MTQYVILGGFLGSGKTTTMIAFAKCMERQDRKAAILVNDLGARDLVDERYTEYSGCLTEEITGDCICYVTEDLVDKLRRFRDRDHADLIMSDIPGCGIGAYDHVYHRLDRDYHGEFDICPFIAVADTLRLQQIMPNGHGINLPGEMTYLFDAQLREAEVILLNKIDLISDEELASEMEFLKDEYSDARVFAISAKQGTGIEEALDYLLSHASDMRSVDIGYGGPEFVAAEKTMSWYGRKLFLKSLNAFDGNAVIADFLEVVRRRLIEKRRNVPHLKVYAEDDEGKIAKASLTGVDYGIDFDVEFSAPSLSLSLTLNARATCESSLLDEIIDASLAETATAYSLSQHVFFTECFGMTDEGR